MHRNNMVAIPISGLGLAYYYNKDVYKSLGLSVPETWNEFLANCEAIEKTNMNPVAFMAQKQDAVNWLQVEAQIYRERRYLVQRLNLEKKKTDRANRG